MSKQHSNFFVLLAISFFALFISCKQQTIFYQIEQETELEDAVIDGNVTSIVSYSGKLYACDGIIYTKDASQIRGWEESSKPAGFITKLAASTSALYAMNSDRELFQSPDGSNWEEVDYSSTLESLKTIFCDNNGNAYAEGKKKGAEAESFFTLSGGTLSETTDVASSVVVSTGSVKYTATGETVSDTLGGSATDLETIYSITYSAADKAVYVGTDDGLKKLPLDESGKLTGEKADAPGNWSSTIKDYKIFALLASGTNTSDAALYVGPVQSGSSYSTVTGMWSYYYSRRNSWNVE